MPGVFFHTLFGDRSRAFQAQGGSRDHYARREEQELNAVDDLGERELSFLAKRNSIYLATVTADGWPYVQHRGGPIGFVRPLGGNRIGFVERPGNRQYITIGNAVETSRMALIAMDYPAQRRLKLIGLGCYVVASEAPDLVEQARHPELEPSAAALVIDVIGYDWNCPQYITPRFTRAEIEAEFAPLRAEAARLRGELARRQGAKP
jgi:uncharacterized protein